MIYVVAVGRIKENYLREGISLYVERISSLTPLKVFEVRDSSPVEEAEHILKTVKGVVVVLDVCGETISSEDFSAFIRKHMDSDVSFVVGGPEGLPPKVIEEADHVFSLSRMTYTHEIARLVLLEQIYRAFMLIKGRRYHR